MWKFAAKATATTAAGGLLALARLARANHKKGAAPKNVKYCYKAPPTREEMISRMKTELFDVVVVGGGATGSGVALDTASRGLKCALIESHDFAAGTSSRSTKLIHGGIRYLEAAIFNLDIEQFKLVCEALDERSHLMAAAPHMARPVPILLPLYKLSEIPMMWTGVKVYDWLGKFVTAFKPGLPNCFWMSRSNALHFFPLLNPKKLKGAIAYYDGQMNDARMNLDVALTSTIEDYVDGMKGACAANYCAAKNFTQERNTSRGDVTVITAEDKLTGETFKIVTRAVVNCTGPFTDTIRTTNDSKAEKLVAASSGSHVTLPSFYSSAPFGMIIPKTTDGRVLYYLPWQGSTIAGTTDHAANATHNPSATPNEVDFVVKESCRYLSVKEEDLWRDLKATWTGFRPLVTDPKASASGGGTKKLSRTHEIVVEKNGMISVMGGKWTTYRRMAQDAVNKVVEVHGKKFPSSKYVHQARTKFLKLSNAIDHTGRFDPAALSTLGGSLAPYIHKTYGLTIDQARHLVSNYGFRSLAVCEMGEKQKRLTPLVPEYPFLRAEVVYATRHEMARTPSDVLARRTRLAFLDVDVAKAALETVVKDMSTELGWSTEQTEAMRQEGSAFLKTMSGGMKR